MWSRTGIASAVAGLTFGTYVGYEEPVSFILRSTSRVDHPYKTDPSTETGESHLGSQPWHLASLSQEKQIESNGLELGRALLGRCPSRQIS